MRIIVWIIFFVSLFSCATGYENKSENQLIHIVLIWLNEPGNEIHIKKIVNATQKLKEIDEIKELRIGRSIPSNRKIVDDSFDIGLYMIFDNEEAMQRYLVHPKHKSAVKMIIMPLARQIRVYDYVE